MRITLNYQKVLKMSLKIKSYKKNQVNNYQKTSSKSSNNNSKIKNNHSNSCNNNNNNCNKKNNRIIKIKNKAKNRKDF